MNHHSQIIKGTVDDYDSYSSEDEQLKTTSKKHNKTLNKINLKPVNIKNRASAPARSESQNIGNKTIADRLYMPFISDKCFKVDINNKLTRVKEDSKNNAIFTHKLIKKKDEVDKIGKQLFIYNNPSKLNTLNF